MNNRNILDYVILAEASMLILMGLLFKVVRLKRI